MPHMIVSVSRQLAEHQQVLLHAAHEAMLASEIAPAEDVKSRAVVWEDFLVGEGLKDEFVHVQIHILQKAERTHEVQKALSDKVMQALIQVLPSQKTDVQVSCDIVLMNPVVYGKQKVFASQ